MQLNDGYGNLCAKYIGSFDDAGELEKGGIVAVLRKICTVEGERLVSERPVEVLSNEVRQRQNLLQ